MGQKPPIAAFGSGVAARQADADFALDRLSLGAIFRIRRNRQGVKTSEKRCKRRLPDLRV
jgi:hypothetical protein